MCSHSGVEATESSNLPINNNFSLSHTHTCSNNFQEDFLLKVANWFDVFIVAAQLVCRTAY